MIHTEFIGRLVNNPELKKITTKAGEEKSVANITLAVNRLYSDKVDYVDATVWGKQAEHLVEGNSKGSRVSIIGNFETDVFEKEDGTKVKNYNVNVDTIQFLDRKIERNVEQEAEQNELER